MLTIVPATGADRASVCAIFREILAAGETYVHESGSTDAQIEALWFGEQISTFVAWQAGEIVGAYKILPNYAGRGAHTANGSYIVHHACRGRGIGRRMVKHSLAEAQRQGYRFMQFNFVVSTNKTAVRLYQNLGFEILATLTDAFDHPTEGFVDSYLMRKSLTT